MQNDAYPLIEYNEWGGRRRYREVYDHGHMIREYEPMVVTTRGTVPQTKLAALNRAQDAPERSQSDDLDLSR